MTSLYVMRRGYKTAYTFSKWIVRNVQILVTIVYEWYNTKTAYQIVAPHMVCYWS